MTDPYLIEGCVIGCACALFSFAYMLWAFREVRRADKRVSAYSAQRFADYISTHSLDRADDGSPVEVWHESDEQGAVTSDGWQLFKDGRGYNGTERVLLGQGRRCPQCVHCRMDTPHASPDDPGSKGTWHCEYPLAYRPMPYAVRHVDGSTVCWMFEPIGAGKKRNEDE